MGRSQKRSLAAAERVCTPPQPFPGSNDRHAAGEKDRRVTLREKRHGALPADAVSEAPHRVFPRPKGMIGIHGCGAGEVAPQWPHPWLPFESFPAATE